MEHLLQLLNVGWEHATCVENTSYSPPWKLYDIFVVLVSPQRAPSVVNVLKSQLEEHEHVVATDKELPVWS